MVGVVSCYWQGWLVTGVYTALTIIMAPRFPDLGVAWVLLTAVLVFICYKTGEKPRWRWGDKKV
jgi:hypothetical protein